MKTHQPCPAEGAPSRRGTGRITAARLGSRVQGAERNGMSRYGRAESHGAEHFDVAAEKAWQSDTMADRAYLRNCLACGALPGVRGQLGVLSPGFKPCLQPAGSRGGERPPLLQPQHLFHLVYTIRALIPMARNGSTAKKNFF